jgi:hypothetical protein
VQDSNNPDATPFIVDADGQVGIGTATPSAALEIASPGVYKGAWAYLPTGTAMLFAQTSAPTGWTKSTTHDNKALRVVSGSASSGGSVAFTTAFASQAVSGTVGDTTLTIAQIPSHTHGITIYTSTAGASGSGTTPYTPTSNITAPTGGGGSHTHTFTGTAINLAVSYVDVIIATKD